MLDINKEYIETFSEGEQFIIDYLRQEKIKYETQVKIESLRGDSKYFRQADFYLPRYDMYLEFFGQWNSTKSHRE